LPANALGQSMHQCLAEMHFAGKRAPTGDQSRFRVPGGCQVIWRLGWAPAAVANMDRYRPPTGVAGGERFQLPSHRCRSALARECAGSVNASVPGENAFRGQARSYRRSIALRGSRRVLGDLASWMGACCSGKDGSSSAACRGAGGERFRLPSHRCRSALARECVGSVDAKMHFAGKRAPTGDQLRFRVPGGAGGRSRPSASTVGFTRCELAGKRSASAYHTSSAIP
jgi:hypothetical protein